jgi:hypothetical protein
MLQKTFRGLQQRYRQLPCTEVILKGAEQIQIMKGRKVYDLTKYLEYQIVIFVELECNWKLDGVGFTEIALCK